MLNYDDKAIAKAVKAGVLVKVPEDEEETIQN